jgi:hypothetical protein
MKRVRMKTMKLVAKKAVSSIKILLPLGKDVILGMRRTYRRELKSQMLKDMLKAMTKISKYRLYRYPRITAARRPSRKERPNMFRTGFRDFFEDNMTSLLLLTYDNRSSSQRKGQSQAY